MASYIDFSFIQTISKVEEEIKNLLVEFKIDGLVVGFSTQTDFLDCYMKQDKDVLLGYVCPYSPMIIGRMHYSCLHNKIDICMFLGKDFYKKTFDLQFDSSFYKELMDSEDKIYMLKSIRKKTTESYEIYIWQEQKDFLAPQIIKYFEAKIFNFAKGHERYGINQGGKEC